jgi:urease accessory protein
MTGRHKEPPMTSARRLAFAAALALVAGPALAHPGHGGATFAAGLLHPLSGLDHILAMVAVGLLAARRGGRALIVWPLAFVGAMLAGYGLGLLQPGVIPVQPGIFASVIVLGALAASSIEAPTPAGVVLIAVFGLCHGYAHGSEAPAGAGAGFPLGFAIATAGLHGAGVALGLMLRRRPAVLRALGGAVALGGMALVLAG